MAIREHRKNLRVRRKFSVRLFIENSNLFIEGITKDLSQGGPSSNLRTDTLVKLEHLLFSPSLFLLISSKIIRP